jgi:hypothetical protein
MNGIIETQLTTRGITNLFIWILTSALWHGLYQFSSPSLVMSSASLCLLNLIFLSIPNCRLKIRLASAAYSDGFLILLKINRFFNEISTLNDPSNLTNDSGSISTKFHFLSNANVFYLHGYVVVRYIILTLCRRLRQDEDENRNSPRSDFDDGVCPICMLGPQETPSRPDCGHTYCYECLSRWSRIRMECPMCSRRFNSFRVFPKGEIQGPALRVHGPDFLIDDYPMIEMNFNVCSGWFWGLWDILKSTFLFTIDLISVFNCIPPLAILYYHFTQAFQSLVTFM